MRSHRLAATVLLTALLLGLLPATGVAGHADVRLVPPAGQTAVKGDDTITIEGAADSGAEVTNAVLRALDANGDTLGAYDFGGRVTNNGGTLSGSFQLACGFVPGCLEDDDDLRASVDAYRLELTLGEGSHEVVSPAVEFDEVDPFIVGYFLIAPDRVEVRFSEDVADPQGDTLRDWRVDGAPPVGISGEGDRRVLQTATPFAEDATPSVRYETQTGLGSVVSNEPYLDEAGNDLLARNRFSDAADRIAPDPPSIDAINGTATTRDGDDQAVPVLGSDPTPTVTIGSIEDGHTARLWRDDGDGTLEDDRDTLVGEAVASGGTAEVEWPDDQALPDDVHRLFARALDGAECDPNDTSSDERCPNASARSQDALYDLDTTEPTLVDPALASTSAVTVVLSEPVTGPNTAEDWTITNSDGTAVQVDGVSGSGDTRVLEADGVLPDATLRYAATDGRYVDDHDNQLQDATVDIVAQPLPVVHLVDAEPVAERDGPDEIVGGVEDPSYEEAESTFRVELSDPAGESGTAREGETVTVTMQVVPDTAAADVDYTDPGEITVSLTGDETGTDVPPVELIGDTLDEIDETFELHVTDVTNAEVADATATGTITDDDAPPALSVADATVGEDDEDGVAEVTVSIDAASGKQVSAEWSLRAGTATPGRDYQDESGTLTIPAGETTATVQVTVLQDDLDEDDETFEVALDEATNATIDQDAGDDAGTVTITDEDPEPRLRISDFTGFEGDADRTERVVVTMSEASGRDVQVNWETSSGTGEGDATADEDYTSANGTVTIPAGGTSASIDLQLRGDTTSEPDESFEVLLSEPVNATIGDGTGVVTLLNDDGDLPVIELSVSGGEIGEGAAGVLQPLFPAEVTWTLTLDQEADGPIQVDFFTTDDGEAKIGDDFENSAGTVEIPEGERSVQVTSDVIDDDLYEGDETVALVVNDPVRADLVDDTGAPVDQLTTMATITDDETAPTVAFADGSEAVVVTEGQDATFTVELDAVSGRDATVDWETVFGGSATTDDLPSQAEQVTIPAGQTTESFTVTTTDDGDEEGDETVTIELSTPSGATLAEDRPVTSQLTLADDEVVVPTITLNPGEGDEDPGALPPLTSPTPVDFLVELDQTAEDDVTVRYRTTNAGDATAESDFTGTSGTLTIPAGDISATIDVEVLDDDLHEFDETVQLVLSDPVRARLEGGAAELPGLGTILDDDDPVVASLGEDTPVDEGEAVVLEVTLDAPSGRPVTVDWQTADQSADGSDYEQSSGTLEFDPDAGETSKSITVETLDDADVEGNEDFRVELTAAEHAEIGDGEAVVTITDNDDDDLEGRNLLSLSSASVDEGDPPALPFPPTPAPTETLDFELTLQDPASEEVQVDWVATAGTADGSSEPGEGRDFDPAEGTATIPATEESTTIEVATYTDLLDEFDETVVVAITAVRGGDAAEPTAGLQRTGRILDDDPPAEIAFANESVEVTEGEPAEFTVELDTASGKPVTVDWATSYDGAADTDDVLRQSGQVTVAAGRTTATFEVDTEDDDASEGDEDLSVVLSAPNNGRLSDDRPTVARLVLLDDELPVLTIDGGSVDEAAVGLLGPADPGIGLEAADAGGSAPGTAAAVSPLEEDLPFTVTLAEAVGQDATVRWTTTTLGTATAGADYTAQSGTLTIPAGETEGEVAIDVHLDDLDEFDETVVVRFSDARGAQLPEGAESVEVVGTIIDDDPLVTVELGDDVDVDEGQPATFEVTLVDAEGNEKDSGKDIELRYRTSNGTARAGQDYRATDDTLTIPAGDTSGTFTVPTLDDSLTEEAEDLQVTLSVVADDTAQLGRSAATLTITDDDLGLDPDATVVSLTGDAVDEGDPAAPLPLPIGRNELEFVVQLSRPADGPVTIDYTTRPGTATAGDDFESTEDQVTIADGDDEATVTVPVVPDFTDEFDEQLQLVVTGVSGDAVVPGGQLVRTGRILDDDPQAQLRVNDATVLEGDVAELDVTLSNASGKDITVAWALVDGTATAGEDYVADSGTLSFPAGTTSRTVQAATLADGDTGELIEQFELVLSSATNAGIDDSRGTVSIIDIGADGLPTGTAVFLEDITTQEVDGDRTALVPVRLSGERDEDTTVTWSTQQLTAAEGEDYRAEGGEVVIPAGATSAQIPVTIIGDEEPEPNEDFLVLLTEADGAVITGPTGRVTIEDDDEDGSGGPRDGPGSDGDVDGAPGGSDGSDGSDDSDGRPGTDQGAGELPATGGGAGFVVFGLALLAARRRRRGDD